MRWRGWACTVGLSVLLAAGCAPRQHPRAAAPPLRSGSVTVAVLPFRVGGENVAPAEVEEVLLAHPAVATAQVVGVPDPRLGEVGAAFVTLKGNAPVTESELTAFVRQRCANFRVPRYLAIVASFDAIGMTASGKVQKTALRQHAIREFKLDVARAEAGAAR